MHCEGKEADITGRTLVVHIGHPKTGTSYIQDLLATNKPQLERNGIRYPDTAFTLKARQDDPGRGGNCRVQLLEDSSYQKLVTSGSDHVVLSAERLFFSLADGKELFARYAPKFDKINVLLFIRDPLEFVSSWYSQRVKRGDFNGSFDEFVVTNDYFVGHLDRVEGIIDACARFDYELTVRNYNKLTAPLDDVIEELLGLPAGTLQRPAKKKINRGLTRAERHLQQRLNHHLGKGFDLYLSNRRIASRKVAYQIVAEALCMGVPDVEAEYAALSPPIHEEFCRRINAGIARVNLRLPEAERFDAVDGRGDGGPEDSSPDAPLVFSEVQIDVLAKSIAKVLRRCARRDGLLTRLKQAFW